MSALRTAIVLAAVCLGAHVALGQSQRPVARPESASKAAAIANCAGFAAAQHAAYSAYIKLVIDELPDPRKVTNADQAASDGDALYRRYLAAAEAGDVTAARKATALELYTMQARRQPAAEGTQRKLCLLANSRLRDNGVMDALGCAVASLDGGRRDQPANRERARAMMERARAMVPADANASDAGRLLFDEVARGMQGCY